MEVAEAVEDSHYKKIPHCIETERLVLGHLFLYPDVVESCVEKLSSESFFLPAHKIIFDCVESLAIPGVVVDIVGVGNCLKKSNMLEKAGGAAYIGGLVNGVLNKMKIEPLIKKVNDKALQRQLLFQCQDIAEECFRFEGDVAELLTESERRILSLSKIDAPKSVKENINDFFNILSDRIDSIDLVSGISTGFYNLDKMTTGLHPGELIVIAGAPSVGKSSFALCLTINAALEAGVKVAFYSLEMERKAVTERALGIVAGVDILKLRSGRGIDNDDWGRMHYAADVLGKSTIYIDDKAIPSLEAFISKARRLKYDQQISMIVVDYLQLKPTYQQLGVRESELAAVTRSLKALAKELKIPIIVTSQLNRKVETRLDKRPILSDLRGSGAIAEDADLIMFVYQNGRFSSDEIRPAEIIVAKQRRGPVGTALLQYNSSKVRFENPCDLDFDDEL